MGSILSAFDSGWALMTEMILSDFQGEVIKGDRASIRFSQYHLLEFSCHAGMRLKWPRGGATCRCSNQQAQLRSQPVFFLYSQTKESMSERNIALDHYAWGGLLCSDNNWNKH